MRFVVEGGQFVSDRFPYIRVSIDLAGFSDEFEALVDTGFEGDLALPPAQVGGLPPDRYSRWVLANGSEILAPVHDGRLTVGGFPALAVSVLAVGGQPILGRGVTDRFLLILDRGREVRLQL